MKNIFFALSLLVPAVAFGSVKMDVKARLGEDVTAETFEFAKVGESHGIEHKSGVKTVFTLKAETANKASFDVEVLKDDKKLQDATVEAEYGNESSLKCTAENVDAEVKVTVTSTTVA